MIIDDFSSLDIQSLCGWLESEAPYANAVMPSHLKQQLKIEGYQQASRRLMMFEIAKKVLGEYPFVITQLIGDCTSMGGFRHPVQYLQLMQMAMGSWDEFKYIFSPYGYGCERVFVGGGGMWGDGGVGAWIAEAVVKYGGISEDLEGLPKYSAGVAKEWGRSSSTLQPWVEKGKLHLVKSTAKVSAWEQVVDSVCNLYPVGVCSNVGYTMQPQSDGFHHRSGHWAHSMCATPDTTISCIDYKTIKDIEIGDLVVGHDGEQHIVTQTFNRPYNGKLISIRCYGHETLNITPEHPLLVEQEKLKETFPNHEEYESNLLTIVKEKVKVKRWLKAKDISLKDRIIVPRKGMYYKCDPLIPNYFICDKTSKPIQNLSNTSDIAWFLGIYAADGSSSENHKVKITLHENEIESANRCVKALESLGIKATISKVSKKRAIRVTGYSTILATSFLQWFSKRDEKQLPDWVWSGWDIASILQGIFDGDGCQVADNYLRITNTSRKLIYQVYHILLELGYEPFIQILPLDNGYKDRYVIEWKDNYKRNDNTRRSRSEENYVLYNIKSIEEKDYNGLVYNFEVEGCHSYLANGISSHNCIIGVDNDYKDPHACIQNSWGPDCHGKVIDFTTGEEWPGGTLRVRKDDIQTMLDADDSFCYSSFNGFPAQIVPGDFSSI